MEIRPLTPADYPAAQALWHSCRGMGLNDVDDSPEGFTRFLLRNPTTCFAALEAQRLTGVILCGHDGRRGYIYHTAVSPQARGEGIGRALVDAALAALREEGIAKAALVVFKRNEDGNAFWERMGFTAREDLAYRNRALAEMVRIDT